MNLNWGGGYSKSEIDTLLNDYIPKSGANDISGSLIPSTDNAYDLGSTTKNLKVIYSRKIVGNGAGLDICSYALDQGAYIALDKNDTQFNGAFRIYTGTSSYILQGRRTGELSWSGKSIVPTSNSTCNLGSSSYGFKDIYLKDTDSKIYYGGDTLSLRSTGNGVSCILGWGALLPAVDDRWEIGSSTLKWENAYISGTIYCQTVVQTSDYRLKGEIESISDDVLDAWENLEPKQYKYKSDLENDKDNAQIHYGWIAQDVESIIKGNRKGEVKNGLWLHEEWEEQEEVSHEETYTEEVQTKSGKTETVTKTRKVIDIPYKAKGDSYGLRYTECLVVECAYLRRENDKLKQLLQNHEERLKALEK